MGVCLSKKGSEPRHIGHKHGSGGGGVVHNHKNTPSHQPYQLPNKHAPKSPWKPTVPAPSARLSPSPKPVHRQDTILGKPLEDVR